MSQNDISENKPPRPNQFQRGNKLGKGRRLGSKNKENQLTKEQILRDLENIYNNAAEAGHWASALSAKIWQGKFLGIARTRKLPDITKLSDMDAEQLREFVEILAEHDPEVRECLKPEDGLA